MWKQCEKRARGFERLLAFIGFQQTFIIGFFKCLVGAAEMKTEGKAVVLRKPKMTCRVRAVLCTSRAYRSYLVTGPGAAPDLPSMQPSSQEPLAPPGCPHGGGP